MSKRRPCTKCNKNRAERFYVSARGRVCSFCRKGRVQLGNRDVRLKENYGITTKDYAALLAAQGGACAICRGKRTYNLDVDHCHALERAGVAPRDTVRGLLCKQCNRRVLRSVADSVEILEAAIEYLKEPPARSVLKNEAPALAPWILSHHRPVE